MNWLKNLVPGSLRDLVGGAVRDEPEVLWRKCPKCQQMIFHRDLEANLSVCMHCDHHLPMGGPERLAMLFDDGAPHRVEMESPLPDPLRFRDRRKYVDRLKEAQMRTGLADAIVVGHGTMGGTGVVAAVFDPGFLEGAMGMAVGEGLLAGARLAAIQDAPLLVVVSSNGARLQEGVLALVQSARTVAAVDELKRAGLPFIAVLADPTVGGAAASFAMLGDVIVAEPGARIGLAGSDAGDAGPCEEGMGGVRRAEDLLRLGQVDMVVHRRDLRAFLVRLVGLLRNPGRPAEVVALPQVQRLFSVLKPEKARPREKEPRAD